MRVRLLLSTVLLATAVTVAGSSTPAAAAVCIETNRFHFVPALTLIGTSGNVTVAYTKQCYLGGSLIYSAAGANLTFTYSGGCIFTTISDGSTLYGGTLLVAVNKQMLFVPDSGNPCNFSTGVGHGTKIE